MQGQDQPDVGGDRQAGDPRHRSGYDPRRYWNEKARRSAGDALLAACEDDPIDNLGIDRVQRRVLGAALERLESEAALRGRHVLDFGCGSGRWLPRLQAKGCVYHGVDISEEMLAIAREGAGVVDLRRVEDGSIPHGDGSFDVVWSVAVLHHNPYADQERLVGELVRVLKHGGYLVLFEGLGPHAAPGAVESARPLEEWISLLEAHETACLWTRRARYHVLRAVQRGVVKKIARGRTLPRRWLWPTFAQRLDAFLSPYLGGLIPERYSTRAVMVFCKTPA